MKSEKIAVQGIEVTIFQKEQKDYLSLTDIARYKNLHEPKDVGNIVTRSFCPLPSLTTI